MKKVGKLILLAALLVAIDFPVSARNSGYVIDRSELARWATIWDAHRNYSETEVELLPSFTHFAKTIPLTVVIMKNSRWKKQEVIQKVRNTEGVFSQCGVSFSPILLISTIHASGTSVDTWNATEYVDISMLLFEGVALKPVVFMIDQQDPIREGSGGGYAYYLEKAGAGNPNLNTALIYSRDGRFTRNNYYSPTEIDRQNKYEVMAHEMGHLLFNEGHRLDGNNLMRNPPILRSNKIDDDQCRKIPQRVS